MSRFSRLALPFGPLAMPAMLTMLMTAGPAFAALGVGDEAPDFTLPGTDGNEITLSSFRGAKNVVLAFFPKAFTAG